MGNGELCVMMDSDKWRLMWLAGSWDTSLPCFMTMSTELGLYKFEMSTYVYTVFKAPFFFLYLYNVHQKFYTTVACDESVLHTLHLASINDILTKYLTVLKLTHPHHMHTHSMHV